MSGTNIGGANFNQTPADNEIHEWMWWRWRYSTSTDTWEVLDRLESPSESTPGLIYFTPDPPTDLEPPLTYEWWWTPHILNSDLVIVTHGKLHVRDRSKEAFHHTDPENSSVSYTHLTLPTIYSV